MFSSQFEYSDNNFGCYTGQVGRNKLPCAVQVIPLPQLDFMKIMKIYSVWRTYTLYLKSAHADIL